MLHKKQPLPHSASASAKLILSGEHAVCYGAPAIATALPLLMTVELSPQTQADLSLEVPALQIKTSFSAEAFEACFQATKARYQQFEVGERSIETVLEGPASFWVYALYRFCQHHGFMPHHLVCRIQTQIPVGRGLGSSAALIAALYQACEKAFSVKMTKEAQYKLGVQAEHVQHGRASGLDIYCSLYGGMCRFQNGQAVPLVVQSLPTSCLIDTGEPAVSTGECVEKVAPYFKDSKHIQAFSNVTEQFQKALTSYNMPLLKESIQANQALLTEIKVVPKPVQDCVSALAQKGIVAKLCGAGAIAGKAGGVLWALGEPDDVVPIIQPYGYRILPLLHLGGA